MKLSDYQEKIVNQFDYFCKQAISAEQKNYFKHLRRVSRKEVSFSMLGERTVNQFSVFDKKPSDCHQFKIDGTSVYVENERLVEMLKELSNRQREVLLMHYFLDMSDSEIGEILEVDRTTVYRNRMKALKILRKMMEDENYGKDLP